MVCPNCDKVLMDDEQLIVHSSKGDGSFQIDHVSITYQPKVSIYVLDRGVYTRLSID